MSVKTIDAELARNMFLAGAKNLDLKKDWINDLNVFPVPDGDTGTNMTMTIMSAAHAAAEIAIPTFRTLGKAVSSGSLRGARGNSGVILSQLFRGFMKEIRDMEEIGVKDLAAATLRATETAYKAVMKPKEGTILTVAKAVSDKAAVIGDETDDMETALTQIIEHAEYILSKTPEMLPVLKEAGVVDSGGQGLVVILRGMLDALAGRITDFSLDTPIEKKEEEKQPKLRFPYGVEFVLEPEKPFTDAVKNNFKAYLMSVGESAVVVAAADTVKVHVETDHPGDVIESGLKYGQISSVTVDNLYKEHSESIVSQAEIQAARAGETIPMEAPLADSKEEENTESKKFGFVTVAAGAGIGEIFKGLGCDKVIMGGQTMNPSTADILDAAEAINAETIFVLPNNKNIIMAAQQAAGLIGGKKLIVIPTRTIPQGIAAMIGFEPTRSAAENVEALNDAISNVQSGEITYAVRDTTIDGRRILKGNMMGLTDAGLTTVGSDITDVLIGMIESMKKDESELITLYYGKDVMEQDADMMAEKVRGHFPDLEVELQNGGQPVYYYIVSVE
ncbi:MAG: DAK2 domain-containing protein [Lachnospiraceae bacterium]|nr:DAK2 domain-containing protein [Lachnospiraceae bacterium]MCH4030600.1 DAK2 domain-containing protein [Lachnospiraceae bacterium]MCH4069809.1 DAK2 domain-containing protein [Lachnospiraceae bacterium]MCH4107252.1 DAK2 domain-containing protein [Lachnospiraceae bacterium]MCI1301893.1 DAK2 domain-containing protein [Lachnospiraceae bacterium]